jgi:hypothetical protein
MKERKKLTITKKVLFAIPLFLLWFVYISINLKKVNEYEESKREGARCMRSEYIGGVLVTTRYYFDKSKPPIRGYDTLKEFLERFGYF